MKRNPYIPVAGARVYRGGAALGSKGVRQEALSNVFVEEAGTGIEIRTSIPSKGGGNTAVELWFGIHNFHHLIEAMMAADRQATEKAMDVARTADTLSPTAGMSACGHDDEQARG